MGTIPLYVWLYFFFVDLLEGEIEDILFSAGSNSLYSGFSLVFSSFCLLLLLWSKLICGFVIKIPPTWAVYVCSSYKINTMCLLATVDLFLISLTGLSDFVDHCVFLPDLSDVFLRINYKQVHLVYYSDTF